MRPIGVTSDSPAVHPDYEAIAAMITWSYQNIADYYGYTKRHVQSLCKLPGFPKPQGRPPRFPKRRVIEFMISIGREDQNRLSKSGTESGSPPDSRNKSNE